MLLPSFSVETSWGGEQIQKNKPCSDRGCGLRVLVVTFELRSAWAGDKGWAWTRASGKREPWGEVRRVGALLRNNRAMWLDEDEAGGLAGQPGGLDFLPSSWEAVGLL